MNQKLRSKLEQAHRILHIEGLAEDASRGHITAKSEDGRIYIKPWGVGFKEAKAKDFQGLDMDGNLVEGKGRIHSELILHLEIYRQRKDVFSIAHIHPYYSILLSSLFTGGISIVTQKGVRFTGKIPFFRSASLIQSKEPAQKLAQILGEGPLVLMKNHGITMVGKSIEETVILAIHFEQAARDHLLANLFGKPKGMSAREAKKMSANNYTPSQLQMLWDYHWNKYQADSRVEGESKRII